MSKQRKLRGITKLSFHEEEEDAFQAKPPAQATAAQRPVKHVGSSSLLSFGEDGGDIPAPRKVKDVSVKDSKKLSSKFARSVGPPAGLPVAETGAAHRPSAGEYTADRLKDLQKNAISFSATKFAESNRQTDEGNSADETLGNSLIKLSGSFKPAAVAADDRFTIDSTALVKKPPQEVQGDDMPLPAPPRSLKPHLPPSTSTWAMPGVDASGQGSAIAAEAAPDEDDSSLPSEETIRLAKARRERLRQARFAPDYIPLAGSGGQRDLGGLSRLALDCEPSELAAGSGGGSEEERDAEDAMRIRFSASAGGATAGRHDTGRYATVLGGDADGDAFADEQLRKAIRTQQDKGRATRVSSRAVDMGGTNMAMDPGFSSASRQSHILAGGHAVMDALREGMQRLAASQKAAEQNLANTSAQLTSALARIEGLEGQLKTTGDRFVAAQQMRAYIADLCDCLAAKSALVEALEETRLELMEDRASAARAASRAMEADILKPAEAAVAAAVTVLSRGGAMAAASAAAASAAREAEYALHDEAELPVELDEFGRNMNLQAKHDLQQRSAKRRRLLEVARKQMSAATEDNMQEGLAANGTTHVVRHDEPEDVDNVEEVTRYVSRYADVREAAATVFADAAEDFAALSRVKERLEHWKASYPDEYSKTYMAVSNPALFAPYVRLELLSWDPFFGASSSGFDDQAWYGLLFNFGLGAEAAAVSPEDPDMDLVPQLVRKVVLPMVLHVVERCWDVTSVAQSRCVAALVADVLVYVPADDARMVKLLGVLQSALDNAVAECTLPTWPPSAVQVSDIAGLALYRRFRNAVRVLHSLAAFEGFLSRPLLLHLSLTKVLSQQLLPYLYSASSDMVVAAHRLHAVVHALHADWFLAAVPAEAAPLMEFVELLTRSYESHRGDRRWAQVSDLVVQLLQHLGQNERSAHVAGLFGAS